MYATKSTAELLLIEQNARKAAAEGEAKGASAAVMRARYGVLGAVSAELAKRKSEPKGCGYCLGAYEACPSCYE